MLYRYTDKDLDLLGRLIRAEAVGEGREGMLMVGNVVNNRIIAYCHVFKDLRTLRDVLYQRNAFAAVNSPKFNARATTKEKDLAKKSFRGHRLWPATNALWFYAPGRTAQCRDTWFDQQFTGKYRNHCFYRPDPGVCEQLD